MSQTGIVIDKTEIVPRVGMTGLYSLKQPYTALIDPTIHYTCIGVTTISAMVAQGLDPLTDIYLLNEDTEENYKIDEDKNRTIIKLQSGSGNIVEIPTSCLNRLPDIDGVIYSNIMLGINLSILPNNVDLSNLKLEISDLVLKRIGVKSNVFETVIGGDKIISHTDHSTIESARLNKMTTNSNLSQLEQLKNQNSLLIAKLTQAENYIKNKHI
jgi:hypothetical protein